MYSRLRFGLVKSIITYFRLQSAIEKKNPKCVLIELAIPNLSLSFILEILKTSIQNGFSIQNNPLNFLCVCDVNSL